LQSFPLLIFYIAGMLYRVAVYHSILLLLFTQARL